MNLKDTLFASTLDLFLKYGIKSVSMDDISHKLGISKKTIYSCISNKEELIDHVLVKYLAEDECQFGTIHENSTDAIDEMVKITSHILAFLRKMTPSIIYDLKKYHTKSWQFIESQHFAFIENFIFNNLVRGQNEGLYRLDFDPRVIAKLYVHKSTGLVNQEIFPLDHFDRIDLFSQMITYHLYGIVSEVGSVQIKNLNLK